MNDDYSWIPGTVVLAAGLLAGLWLAFRLRRPAAETAARDLELEIADLEARRDELYARLRGDGEDELDAREVALVEASAARTLRDLDHARAQLGKVRPAAARPKAPKAAVPAVPAPASAGGHNPVLWFALGVGLTALVSVLVILAMRDASPDPSMAAQAPAAAPEGHPEGLEGVSPEIQSQAAALEAELARNPGNVEARKQLAVLLASHQQFFQAFQHAEEILRVEPDDPDALYISSLVRLTMGQADVSLELIDRVLAQYPEHVLAHVVRGMALIRLGDRDAGLAAWRQGVAASGGSNRDIERLIADEFGAEAVSGSPAPASPVPVGPAPAPPAATAAPRVYRVYAELVPGAAAPPGSALFVSVHGAESGPPAAVKRVASPSFPVEVTLTAADSMMGLELPPRATVVLRLDEDGDPGTEGPGDLVAQGEATAGEVAKFVLW